ncbi:unnamed protein product [Hermetia illucens]|uniref:N-acetyltransferase 9-like protein n=1 Tax=Hermetia illucens TaxID=343691 RepID=A0A7R8UBM0_HERIL|nr:N-acetyltransferase 9-like protein [Hermetia illucens]CAD7077788.1 unnamed protein product [Hermetia illucens]
MKCNENIKLVGTKVILVPYEAKHVPKYHEWMKDPELQELTASEPLTIDEEYDMQKSWREDGDKCTFLVLSKEAFEKTQDEIESLIGDTNLFLCDDPEGRKVAEAEIMIADKNYQGQRLGWEAMLLMLDYGVSKLKIEEYIVKIGDSNEKSINMFKKMQFDESARSDVFKEVTMRRIVSNEWCAWLQSQVNYVIEKYER